MMKRLVLSAIERETDGRETGKNFSVSVPYQKGLEDIIGEGTYSATEAINRACRVFHSDGRNYMPESNYFCGRISEPRIYEVKASVVEESELQKSKSDLEESARSKVQKFLRSTIDSGFRSKLEQEGYFEQVPFDLLEVAAYFRGLDEDTVSRAHYNLLLNKTRRNEACVHRGDTLYDIGIGRGDMLPDLAEAVGPDGKVCGIDICPEMLSHAKRIIEKKSLKNVHISFGDGRDLSKTPLKYGRADEVVIFGVLQYLDKPKVNKVLNEAVKAPKPEGKIFVSTPAQEYMLGSAKYHHFEEGFLNMIEGGSIPLGKNMQGSLFSKEQIVDEFEKRGFSAEVYSFPNSAVMPQNMLREPSYIRNLPCEHFVVAEAIS